MLKVQETERLLGAGVLGDGFGSLRHSMLCQLSRKEQTHGSLDFSAGDCGAAVVVCQPGSLSSYSLKDVIHKAVHDAHGFAGDSSVRVDLLQHLVDVNGIALLSSPPALLVPSSLGLGL